MSRERAFRILSALLAIAFLVIGTAFLATFVSNTMLPHGTQLRLGPVSTDYWGYYMMGFAGALVMTWGAFLVTAARAPRLSRGVGTATAFGLALNALFRNVAWFSGEYAESGNALRMESAVMLLLALAFIWLRPPREEGKREIR